MAQTYAQQLTAAKAQLDELLASPIEEHADAHNQRYRRRKIEELTKMIDWLELKVAESTGPARNLVDLRRHA